MNKIEEPIEVVALLSRVSLAMDDDAVVGTVIGIQIRPADGGAKQVMYEIEWWDGRQARSSWFYRSSVFPTDGKSRYTRIGFSG